MTDVMLRMTNDDGTFGGVEITGNGLVFAWAAYEWVFLVLTSCRHRHGFLAYGVKSFVRL